ncbi:MAG: hypothetical protein AB8B56_07130 [Crocinitomicaceae bacterium]
MKHLLFVGLAFLLATCSVQANSEKFEQTEYPSCEEIFTYVVNNLKELPSSNQSLSIAKKPEGYFLAILNYENRRVESFDYVPIWKVEGGEYIRPVLTGIETKKATKREVENHLSNVWNRRSSYDFQLYIGYPEASLDMIEALEGKEGLNLTHYEQLARAYSNLGTRYIHPRVAGLMPEFAKDFKLSNYDKISQDRLDKSVEYFTKSLDYWEKIENQDPNYLPHIIKNLQLKIANEKMHYWLEYTTVQEPKLAKKMLDKVQYSNIDLEVAKRTLDNCAQNTFLFTNGDNDSFPLWFLQEKHGYRKDVVIMNTSLMQTAWYLSTCKARHNYKTSLTSEDYRDFESLVIVPYSEGEITIQSILQDSLPKLNGSVPEEGYMLVPRVLEMNTGSGYTKVDMSSYLSMWHLSVYDIIMNNPERTFSTIWPGATWKQLGLKEQGTHRGTISQLYFNNADGTSTDERSVTFLKSHLEKVDLSKINESILTRFEAGILFGGVSQLEIAGRDEYEMMAKQLIDQVNVDDIVSLVDRPYLIQSFFSTCEKVDPEKGQELLKRYRPVALKIIQSINDDGSDLLDKQAEISVIFELFSGTSLYRLYGSPNFDRSKIDTRLLIELHKKLKTIDSNVTKESRMKTAEKVKDYIESIGTVLG